MWKRWTVFGAVWISCLLFYIAYRQWLSWLLLMAVTAFPLLSLLLSLPAMLLTRVTVSAPQAVQLGTPVSLQVQTFCPLPQPYLLISGRAQHCLTGETVLLCESMELPSDHCGVIQCKLDRLSVCDYLGLFRLKLKKQQEAFVFVWPVPVQPDPMPDISRYLAGRWRPKVGGGFAENHELRPYRPGDSLQHIHWKLTAKTGNLIFREPVEPENRRVLVQMDLTGTPEQLDSKLGQLLWTSKYLLVQALEHDLLVQTGTGRRQFRVCSEQDLNAAIADLLAGPLAQGDTVLDPQEYAAWLFHIGGGDDEA